MLERFTPARIGIPETVISPSKPGNTQCNVGAQSASMLATEVAASIIDRLKYQKISTTCDP